MKILAINGSPKKGNCYWALNLIKEKYPDIDFKLITLNETNLKPCKGCYLCIGQGEDMCPLKDDRDMIVKEIASADGIILASPVHVNHVSTLMKDFINRLGYLAHRPRYFEKQVMVMAIGGGFGADKANEYMSGVFSVFGFNIASSVELYMQVKEQRENARNQQMIIDGADKLIDTITKGQGKSPEPTMLKLIYFNIFKSTSELQKKYMKADYEFYRDKADYHYNTKINPVKKIIAKRIARKELANMVKNR